MIGDSGIIPHLEKTIAELWILPVAKSSLTHAGVAGGENKINGCGLCCLRGKVVSITLECC